MKNQHEGKTKKCEDFPICLYFCFFQSHRNLSQLPNFAFSLPLAMFYQADKNQEDTSTADELVNMITYKTGG